jgi:hypothetical protein
MNKKKPADFPAGFFCSMSALLPADADLSPQSFPVYLAIQGAVA